jgi:hypothetical protein
LTKIFTTVKVLSVVTPGEDHCFAVADLEKLIEKEWKMG